MFSLFWYLSYSLYYMAGFVGVKQSLPFESQNELGTLACTLRCLVNTSPDCFKTSDLKVLILFQLTPLNFVHVVA